MPQGLRTGGRHGIIAVAGVFAGWESGDWPPFVIPTARDLSFYTRIKSGIRHEDDGLDRVEDILADVVGKVENRCFAPTTFFDRTLKLAEISDAQAYIDDNKAVGKVVVAVL